MKPFRAKARRAKRQPNYRLDDTLHKRSDTDYSFNQTSKPCVEDWLWSRREMERYDGFIYQQHKEMKVKNVINPGTDCRQQWHEAVIRLHQIRLGFHSIPAEVWPRSRAQTVGMNFIKTINLPAVIIRRREEKEKKKQEVTVNWSTDCQVCCRLRNFLTDFQLCTSCRCRPASSLTPKTAGRK